MHNNTHQKRLTLLRKQLAKHQVEGYLIPTTDAYQNEFVPPQFRRLEWLTGFTGSNGVAIVLKDKAAFFTDGRYTLQASMEVPGVYAIHNMSDISPQEWLQQHAVGKTIAYDPWLFSHQAAESYEGRGIKLVALQKNLVDTLWKRSTRLSAKASLYAEKYTGRSSLEKREDIAKILKERGVDAHILTAPESICWLLNIRGEDTPCTPLLLCYAIIYNSNKVCLFAEPNKIKPLQKLLGKAIEINSTTTLSDYINNLKNNIISISKSAPEWFFIECRGTQLRTQEDPCTLPKACKNSVEIKQAESIHIQDGVAVASFLHWLHTEGIKKSLTETGVAKKILAFRKQQPNFLYPSFETIAGFKEHGAIVHYHATRKTDKRIKGNGLLLVDSGGQYLGGTTDITRTIAIGKPTAEQRAHFTRVLKGHIALANAIFPEGTTGAQLDVLARRHLWQAGLDYDHGTGHGVGNFLGVHEGPQRISKWPNDVALQPGMILSNEPGYYKEGSHGIRIENLVCVVKKPALSKGKRKFLGFKTLTLAPMDMQLVDKKLLNRAERQWLQEYHQQVHNLLMPFLKKEVAAWLAKSCLV